MSDVKTGSKPQDKAPKPESRYKDSVNLPKTDFPMKGNLPTTEPITLERWKSTDLYGKIIKKNGESKKFVMPDGPPYANGDIHIGHVLNKILKDIVIKYKNMQGFKAEYIPGWDCHGLPIELKVTSALGDKKKDLTKKQIRNLCREEAQKWINVQRDQFKRLGILGDWDKPYTTMQPDYEAGEIKVLAKIQDNGIFYRGNKPVYWCPALQTALAAAEVEYHDHKSLSVYVKFFVDPADAKITKSPLGGFKKPLAFVIWTTTPWTLPANYGIALNAHFEYGAYDTGKEFLVIATKMQEAFEKDTGLTLGRPTKTWKGSELENLSARHPFMNRNSLVVLGDHVSLDAGTGAVHTAPGHGLDDYHVGLKYDLPVASPVDPAGRYTADVPQYQGQSIWKANPLIVEALKNSGHLIAVKEIVHSYPHNPRSKTPLIFRATPQWFIRMDDDFALRKKTLDTIDHKIQFFPDWGKARLTAMVSNTPDWCMSRQRTWGVPIPVFFCHGCGEPLVKSSVMRRVAEQMEKTGLGIEAYFDLPTETFTQGEKCEKCGGKAFDRSEDILDVWFDSGVCHTSVHMSRLGLKEKEPADIYLEGSDQHRGWFQTSLLSSMAAYETPPFSALITHGFVNDAQGHKMSKSKGNGVEPAEVTKKYGAEILRLWVAHEDYGDDVTVSDEMFQRVAETYRRIRNTMRFLLGNIGDFDPVAQSVPFSKMPALDRYALVRLNEVIKKATAAYDHYDFYKVYHTLNQFFTTELSATYLDILKDRLYTGKKDGVARRSSQTVFFHLLNTLVGLLAPILSFLSEETYGFIPGSGKKESVFLTEFPKPHADWNDDSLAAKFAVMNEVRVELAKSLEELRQNKVIGSSLDAEAHITAKGERYKVLNEMKETLREFFIVSNVVLKEGENKAVAQKAIGEKCERCWHYNKLTTGGEFPNVCPKCIEALS